MSDRPVTYIKVNLAAIKHNTRQVLSHLSEQTRLCAVVKANAYGHGAPRVAQACIEAGATWVAVSTVEEGVKIRQAGVDALILVFMPPLTCEIQAAVEYNLTLTFTNSEQVMQTRREAERQRKVICGHVYEDLGLSRLGSAENIMDIIATADPWPEIRITGAYSHFGPPGSGVNLDQLDWITNGASLKMFATMLHEAARRQTDERLILHLAASSRFLEDPASHFDMVRIGTLLYGQYPDHIPQNLRTLELQDTFDFYSHIVEIHEVEQGAKVGYGGEFICRRNTRIATVPVGFSHGLATSPDSVAARPRSFLKALIRQQESKRGKSTHLPRTKIGEASAPIIGRVSMDQCALDVTDLPHVQRGDEVILPVRRLMANPVIPRIYEDDK